MRTAIFLSLVRNCIVCMAFLFSIGSWADRIDHPDKGVFVITLGDVKANRNIECGKVRGELSRKLNQFDTRLSLTDEEFVELAGGEAIALGVGKRGFYYSRAKKETIDWGGLVSDYPNGIREYMHGTTFDHLPILCGIPTTPIEYIAAGDDGSPILRHVEKWYLVSDFGVQKITGRRNTFSHLVKIVGMSNSFDVGERTGQLDWDVKKQMMNAFPTVKNVVTNEIYEAFDSSHDIHFSYDEVLSARLKNPAFTSNKVAYKEEKVCLEWRGKVNVATCASETSTDKYMKNTFALIENKDAALSYYNRLVSNTEIDKEGKNSATTCVDNPFCDKLGHDYLRNIYTGDYAAVRSSDLQVREGFRKVLLKGQSPKNPFIKNIADGIPYSSSNTPQVLDRYLLAYKRFPENCFPGGRQSKRLEKMTDTMVEQDQYGNPTGFRIEGGVISSDYEVRSDLVQYVDAVGRASSEGSVGIHQMINAFILKEEGRDMNILLSAVDSLPTKVDCNSQEFVAFEKNLLEFYKRVRKEPASQPPGRFVRSH